ncbi:unnamed protein product, partial [Tetraodon nigroviridis]
VYILTKSLIPLLEKNADPRVITVSSGGMLVQKLRIGNLQSERGRYDGAMVYAQHKVRERGELGNPSGTLTCVCVCVCVAEAAGGDDRAAGQDTHQCPLLRHAPRLGRHPQVFFQTRRFSSRWLYLTLVFCRRPSVSVSPSGGQRDAGLPSLHEGQPEDPGAGGRHRALAGRSRGRGEEPQRSFLHGCVSLTRINKMGEGYTHVHTHTDARSLYHTHL